jgi:hypothetical protein
MRTLAILLALVSVGWGAPPVVKLPAEVSGDAAAFIVVRAEVADAKAVKFHAIDNGLNVFPSGLLSDPFATVVTSATKGRFRLLAYSGNEDGPSEPVVVTVVIGNAPPVVVDPTQPPVIDPTDPPVPIPVAGLRVLVLEESADRPPGFLSTIRTPTVENYLNAKCAKGTNGAPEWRVLDDDYTNEQQQEWPQLWRDAYERAKKDAAGRLPWLMVSDGARGESVSMPTSAAAFLAILKKYGGE